MKATITIDDDLLFRAKTFSGISENRKLIRRAIEYIIAYEHAVARAEETGNFDDMRITVLRLYDNEEIE